MDPVSSSTISNWFKNLLLQSGVDTNAFKAQSTRNQCTLIQDIKNEVVGLRKVHGKKILQQKYG